MARQGGDPDGYLSTGTPGLDAILQGFARGAMFLVEGEAGAGKTMLALAFATQAAARGESVVYVTLSESRLELEAAARIHGWDAGRVRIVEGAVSGARYTLFHPSDVELDEWMQDLKTRILEARPSAVVIDSLAEMRLMTQNALRYRRELMALKRFLSPLNSAVLLLDESPDHEPSPESRPRTLCDGILTLEQFAPQYGGERRRLRVRKYRGHAYAGGYHDFVIRKGGLEVFPRLIAASYRTTRESEILSSGVPELDALLGGGLLLGSSTLLIGPAGSGKSSLGLLFAISVAERGGNAAIYTFDERPELILQRAGGLGMGLQRHVDAGRIQVRQVDPVELSPGQFAHIVRQDVERLRPSVLLIDSLNGYIHAMPEERFLVDQMHELLTYLGQQSVSAFLVAGQMGVMGQGDAPASTSYLTDNILLLRFFEAEGEARRSLAVVKKRSGAHERTIRELSFGPGGIHLGEPLRQFQGVLTGFPSFAAVTGQLPGAPYAGQKHQ